MTSANISSNNGSPDLRTGDTLEIDLSKTDVRMLAQPLSTLELTPAQATSASDTASGEASSPNSQALRWQWAAAAGVLVVITATVTVAGGALRANRDTPDQTQTTAGRVERQLMPSTEGTQEQKVHFKNPFDPSEVFEFPAGTSEADARQAVADLLLQRARERDVPTSHKVSASPQ